MTIKSQRWMVPTMRTNQVDLDQETLRALASSNRLCILKLLKLKSMNLTHLSKMLGLPKSSTHKDLAILLESGLISKIATPRKWRYYQLTEKGDQLFSDESRLIIVSNEVSGSCIDLTLDSDASRSGSIDSPHSDNECSK